MTFSSEKHALFYLRSGGAKKTFFYKSKLQLIPVTIKCIRRSYGKNSIMWRLAKLGQKPIFFEKSTFFDFRPNSSKSVPMMSSFLFNINQEHCFHEKSIVTFSRLLELITFRKMFFSDSTSGRSPFFRKMHHFGRFETS